MAILKQKLSLLQGSKSTERLVFEYLDQVTSSQQHFQLLWEYYLEGESKFKEFTQKIQKLHEIETFADDLQRRIELYLYEKTLIPELRGDVALLLEMLDQLLSLHKSMGYHLEVEKPLFPEYTHEYFADIFKNLDQVISLLILCAKSFFTDMERIREYHKKIRIFESETNKACSRLRVAIFDSENLSLTQKIHTRFYIDRLDMIANSAENIVDRITIFVLKRAI